MNSFDDLIEMLRNKKSLSIFLIILYFIIIIFVIIYIWSPKQKIYKYSKYEVVDTETAIKKVGQSYINTLSLNFKLGLSKVISNKISEEYIAYKNCTKQDAINRFKEAGAFNNDVTVYALNSYIHEDEVIYELQAKSSKGSINFNLIETSPGKYNISLDGFYTSNIEYIISDEYDISFNITKSNSTLNKIEYEISITNLKNEYVSIEFGVANSIYIELEDNKQYYLVQNAESSSYTDINKGGTINKTLVFEVPLSVQDKITSMEFNNIKIDGTEKDISINL